MNKIVKLPKLKIGDIVDVVAPASGTNAESFQKAISWLKAQGFVPRFPQEILQPDIYLSNTDENRLKYLLEAIKNKDSKAIWCLRGGYGSLRLVPALLKQKKIIQKKHFIGFSDITTLHAFMNTKWNWKTIHGPVLESCGNERITESDKNELLALLFGKKDELYFTDLIPLNSWAQKLNNKKIIAPIFGGNLCVLCSSLGSYLKPISKKHILFFEDVDERGYKIDRYLQQLNQARFFKNTAAVVFGQFSGGYEKNGENYVWPAIEKFCSNLKIPAFSGLQVGHGERQRPLAFNSVAVLQRQKTIQSDKNLNAAVLTVKFK